MATQRYISTSFWDDRWIRSLNPSDRYLYLYLMTNPLTTIAGIYRITIDRIAFDTGYDERTLRPMLECFKSAGKAIFHRDEWMILPSWPSHQRITARDKIRIGIDSLLLDLPDDVYELLFLVKYRYQYLEEIKQKRPLKGHGRVMEGPSRSSNYSDSDTDTDTDTDLIGAPSAEATAPQELTTTGPKGKQSDQLAQSWEDMLTAKQPSSTWGNYGKERAQCKALASRTRELLEQTPYSSEAELIKAVVAQYDTLKRRGRNEYWTGAPWTPSALIARWSTVWSELAKQSSVLDDAEVIF